MSQTTIVIGAGPNGLGAAIVLAKAGHSVTLIERREIPGGIAAGESFGEGFRTTGLIHDTCHLRPGVIDALGLKVTWQPMPALFGCVEEGEGLSLPRDDQGAKAAIKGVDEGADYEGYSRWLGKVKPIAKALLERKAPAIGESSDIWPLLKTALGVRMLGERDMMELLRIAPSCVDDWLSEHFNSPLVRAMLMGSALTGTWMGPRSPTSALALIIYEALCGQEIKGGPNALIEAMVESAKGAGVNFEMGAEVTKINVSEGKVSGVALADGSTREADTIVSAIGPRTTLLDLVDPLWMPADETQEVQNIRVRGIIAKVNLGIQGELRSAGDQGAQERLWFGPHPLDIERAFDSAKMRVLPEKPVLDVRVPSIADPSLCPEGHHVLSVLVHGAAADLDQGWDDEAREALKKAVIAQLSAMSDLTEERIVASEVLTPKDMSERYGLEGAHLWHGEVGLDQLWTLRPTRSTSQNATPIQGLYVGSGGAHGGGALTCAPGVLCANALLKG